jgi:SAM-dependent methyltransferase
MNEAIWGILSGPAGRAVLARLASEDLHESRTLALLTDLRREFSPEVAGAALTMARLRVRAASKFSRADSMFFTPDGLEQASSEIVSAWRARRWVGFPVIADLGCGIGGDTLALAALPGVQVIAADLDALRLRLAGANLAAYERSARLVQADLTHTLPFRGVPAAFFDPARRSGERRIFTVRDYVPPLDVITAWDFDALAVKLSPGVDLDELHPYTETGAGVEFVSLDGELKEAVLWRGVLGFAGRWATRLEADGSGETLRPRDLPPPPLASPRAYLYEPDPAVIRAGLFGELAERLGIALYRLDESIAYLTSDAYTASAWARAWRVWGWMPFNLKKLRAALRSHGIGRVTVKKRGSPITPEDLIRQLKLDGEGESAVVVLTQIAGQHSAILCSEPLFTLLA